MKKEVIKRVMDFQKESPSSLDDIISNSKINPEYTPVACLSYKRLINNGSNKRDELE